MAIIKYEIDIYEDLLVTAKKLMWKQPLMGFFLATLHKKVIYKGDPEEKDIKTAAVGKSKGDLNYSLYVNAEFWKDLTDLQKQDVLLHELNHICYFHPTMSKSFSQKELFNIAADIEINQHLPNLPDNDMPLDKYVEWIEAHKKEIQEGKIVAPARFCRLEDYGFKKEADDFKGTRYYYDRLMAMMNDQKNQSPMAKSLRQMVASMGEENSPYPCSHNTWKNFEEDSDIESELIDENVKSLLKRIMLENEHQRSQLIGSLPGYLRNLIEDLLKERPPIFNWKLYVRRFVAKSIDSYVRTTRSKPNKRLDEEMPTIKIIEKYCLLMGVDTSGSMSNEDIAQCFTEIHHVYKTGNTVLVAECDAALDKNNDVYKYTGKYPTKRLGLSGGGGTNMDPVLAYANENVNSLTCLIHITDGYIPIPKVKCKVPTLIIITPDGANPEDLIKGGLKYPVIKMNRDC